MAVEKGTKEGKAFQSLTEKHSIIIAECQLKIKFLIIEAGDIDLVVKKRARHYTLRGIGPRHFRQIIDTQ